MIGHIDYDDGRSPPKIAVNSLQEPVGIAAQAGGNHCQAKYWTNVHYLCLFVKK